MTATNDDPLHVTHQQGLQLLEKQTRIIDYIIFHLHNQDKDMSNKHIRIPLLMIQAAGVSIHSITKLLKERDMSIRDAFAISRSVVETMVNASYIAVSGPEMAEKSFRHMMQKRWRDRSRSASFAGWQIKVGRRDDIDVESVPGLSDAIQEYTHKNGQEIRDWNPLPIQKRIEIISNFSKSAGFCLGVATFGIYRTSSELLHGTYYSIEYFWHGSGGATGSAREKFNGIWITEHFISILTACIFAVNGSLDAISKTFSITGHKDMQEEIMLDLNKIVDVLSGLNTPD